MTRTTPEVIKSGLTSTQAADVLRYYDASENKTFYNNNWRAPKVKLGQVAIHTTQSRHSILPNGEPTLTLKEATEGLESLLKEKEMSLPKPEVVQAWPVEPTDTQWDEINKLTDTSGFPLYKAYATIMGIWLN